MKIYLTVSIILGLLIGGLLGVLNKPKLGAGQMHIVAIVKDSTENIISRPVVLFEPIKISAVLYDKNSNQIDSGRLVYVEAPKQASYSRNKHTNAFTQTVNGLYTIEYIATSTGIHEIEFWTVDPDSPRNRDTVISKKIQLLVE